MAVMLMPLAANADETGEGPEVGAEIKAQIQELREEHQELKAQVEAGDITKEEARESWKASLAEIRAAKEAYFADRMENMKEKYENLAENHPELAERIRNRFEKKQEERETRNAERKTLHESLRSGEIDMDTYKERVGELRAAWREGRQEDRENFAEFREGVKERRDARNNDDDGDDE